MNQLTDEQIVYNGKRFRIIHKEFKTDLGKKYVRDIVDTKSAAVILPITSNQEILFIKQLREAIGEYTLELPAGLIEKGEEPIQTAKRELEEETGIICRDIEFLTSVYSSAGYSNEKIYIFVAQNFEMGKTNLDKDEQIEEIEKIPIKKCMELLQSGYFKHANIHVALLHYYVKYCLKQ